MSATTDPTRATHDGDRRLYRVGDARSATQPDPTRPNGNSIDRSDRSDTAPSYATYANHDARAYRGYPGYGDIDYHAAYQDSYIHTDHGTHRDTGASPERRAIMRRLLILFALMAAMLVPGIAHAETIVYDEAQDTGIPKGVVGYDGVKCTGESTWGDVTYRNTIYIGADAGMMERDSKRERAWQVNHCQYMQDLQHNWFWQKRGETFALPGVKITVTGV